MAQKPTTSPTGRTNQHQPILQTTRTELRDAYEQGRAKTPQYAGTMAPGRQEIRMLAPGDRIRVSRSDSGKITLPVYTRHLNATAVVQSVDEDPNAVVPCLRITTDLGICRGAATSAVTIAED